MSLGDHRVARDADLAAEVEQVVLDLQQRRAHGPGELLREQQAEGGIELVDVAERLDARAVLAHARPVTQAGLAGVAGAGGDFR